MFSSAAPILLTEDMLDVSMEQQFDMVSEASMLIFH